MQLGLKLYPERLALIDEFADLFAFFEIYIKPETDLETLKPYVGKPLTIHCAHAYHGFELGAPEQEEQNARILKHSLDAARIVKSPWVIVHPGRWHDALNWERMLTFLDKHYDPLIIFENLPLLQKTGFSMCTTPEQMKKLLERYGARMCLDFSHAIAAANPLGLDVDETIAKFAALKPAAFHITGIDPHSMVDQHKHLFQVENDYRYVKHIGEGRVTFEIDWHDLSREAHLKNIAIIIAACDRTLRRWACSC